MKHIGFCGGSSIFELGSASDMSNFFSLLRNNARDKRDKELIEQIYLRYIRFCDIEQSLCVIKKLQEELQKQNDDFNNDIITMKDNNSITDFSKYFEGIIYCIESAKAFYEDWGVYKPVKIVVTDMPEFMTHRDRPLEQYDVLAPSDPPFWLR
ncbi:hypothetical protein RBA63_09840 [Brenneria goodwinii]|uniref:hypothetical protein n=1 Tax=Brenneria goodwinii TaxID=1109412 RepID=UPI0036F144FA